MGFILRPDMELVAREEEGCAVLAKRQAGDRPSPVFRLHPLQGLVLSLLDGERSRDELVEIFENVFERPGEQAALVVDQVFDRYRQFLVAPNGASPAEPGPDPAAFLFSTSRDFTAIREPAPVGMLWVVTECCTKRCRYCYKDAEFVAEGCATDLALSFERVAELVTEAAEIGVTSVVLSGGEPFLRPDLVDIIGLLVGHGIEVIPITKQRIVGERMRALAATGLERLHVSLDSHRPETVDFLTGVPGSFEQITDTLRAAVEHGVRPVLRPVLTSYNIRHLEELVALTHALGVREYIIDIYGESCGRHEAIFGISAEDYAWLRRVHGELVERYPEAELGLKFDKPAAVDKPELRGCVEGAKGMTFLPDGQVTKCEHWRFGPELTYGDLKTQSILEVWNSEALAEINWADRDAFAASPCHRCKRLEECHYHRGRCSLTALLEYGTACAPDVHCPIGAHQRRAKEVKSHETRA